MSIPKYTQIRKHLIKRISSGEFADDKMLPSEEKLCLQYGVSRITVRRAVEELSREGLVARVPGKGTLLSEQKPALVRAANCTSVFEDLGLQPIRRLIDSQVRRPDKAAREALELPEDSTVFSLARTYSFQTGQEQKVLNYTRSTLRMDLFPGIESKDFIAGSIYQTIVEEYGIEIIGTEKNFKAIMADSELMNLFSIDVSAPLLFFSGVTYGTYINKTLPLEEFECWYNTDDYAFKGN